MQETAASERVELQIGEKKFMTTKATISESKVLSTLVSLQPPPADGQYFVDADPTLFEHVLRYLRTGMYPLFFDRDRGHDEVLYLALLQQARFYQIDRLEAWLAAKSYQDAVRRRTWANSITLCGDAQIEHLEELTHLKNESLKIINISQSTAKCFRCPTRNWRHDGRRQKCILDGCVHRGDKWTTMYEAEMRVLKIDYIVTATEIDVERAVPGEDGISVPPPYGQACLPTREGVS
ncbi:hypothetical protein ACRE_009850 [Hapsidospora chrysogenum ATCC 11550]|uniref:BTB domain-containing protein n=1 Tax=Hapsidospora chrysogenum (strain ATCC 11550 / CBS 779.69 / DSM 880 / IAM 14645 / JCM 23072 / IMI 49137) TaxID=857340 RepID=A0A086TFJ7_HAPC1|nr:hypothetical protein ACRE_009850 [Hapsidospora chrysogenum ATCC 11550]